MHFIETSKINDIVSTISQQSPMNQKWNKRRVSKSANLSCIFLFLFNFTTICECALLPWPQSETIPWKYNIYIYIKIYTYSDQFADLYIRFVFFFFFRGSPTARSFKRMTPCVCVGVCSVSRVYIWCIYLLISLIKAYFNCPVRSCC